MTTTTISVPFRQSQQVPECPAMSVNPKLFGRLLGKLTKRIKVVDVFSESSLSVSRVEGLTKGKCCQLYSSPDGTVTSTYSLDSGRQDGKLSVSFGSVEVREYGRLLVEHPHCPDGLALGLDWKHSRRNQVMHVDLYERIRRSQGRKTSKALEKLCTFDRKVLLMKVGGYNENMLWKVFQKHMEACSNAGESSAGALSFSDD
jgi:hypothetical protein